MSLSNVTSLIEEQQQGRGPPRACAKMTISDASEMSHFVNFTLSAQTCQDNSFRELGRKKVAKKN